MTPASPRRPVAAPLRLAAPEAAADVAAVEASMLYTQVAEAMTARI